jgi:hypothetical protein
MNRVPLSTIFPPFLSRAFVLTLPAIEVCLVLDSDRDERSMRLMKKQMREEQGSDFISDSDEFVQKTLMDQAEVIRLSLPCPMPDTEVCCL